MTRFDSHRVLGEGLTRAAEVLATGSDDAHMRAASRHVAHALGATGVTIM